jgi:FAD/FMN-containing dehydrogenase
VIGSGHADVTPIVAGIAVSTRHLRTLEVDAAARTAIVGAGCTWQDVLTAGTPFGLPPICGSAPAVGVVGFLLGGGLGPIARSVGFSTDHVRSIEMVTADGQIRQVDATSDADLFEVLRGAGRSGFGVVTAVEIEMPALPTIYGGGLYFAAADIPQVLSAWAAFVNDAVRPVPDSLTTSVAILRTPDVPALPEVLRGGHCRAPAGRRRSGGPEHRGPAALVPAHPVRGAPVWRRAVAIRDRAGLCHRPYRRVRGLDQRARLRQC